MDPKPEDLGEFFRTRRIGFGRCLERTMQCGDSAIRAHSIQNRQTIALQQLFLLAYRGLTCELRAIMTGVVQLQSIYTASVERAADSPDSSSPAGQKALE